jgi:peptidoglycan/LPS O-acetylase OafA/YrhL
MSTGTMAETALQRPIRLPFLDGVRACAAIYVLVFHSFGILVPQADQQLGAPMSALRGIFGYGHQAVCVFIVLSGFSLALPIARQRQWELTGGVGRYFFRRARRVLPAYYAALLVSIAVIVGYKTTFAGSTSAKYDEALSAGSLASHVFLVHNWSFDWVYRIDGPMWSVATEVQIYVLLPFVLLPMWRKFGQGTTIALAWAVPLLAFYVLPDSYNLYWAAPWFIGSFALGMWGAGWVTRRSNSPAGLSRQAPAAWAAVGAVAFAIALINTDSRWAGPLIDLGVSVASVAFILWCALQLPARAAEPKRHRVVRAMSTRSLAYIAGFSYSIYLLQHPLLKLSEKFVGKLDLGYDMVLLVQLTFGTAVIVAVAWLFAEFFERPITGGGVILPWWQRRRAQRRGPAELAASATVPAA